MVKAKKTKKTATKRKSGRKNKHRKLKIVLSMMLAVILVVAAYIGWCVYTMPDIGQAVNRTRLPATTLIASNGNEIHSYGAVYSEIIRAKDLPRHVTDAIVYTEDRRFYKHWGFDLISFGRAMIVNAFAGRYAQGGSTITQQVAKNLFLTNQKTITRKVQELLLALWLEHKFTKEQILSLYLNRVYFGNGAYGIEAASNRYFQKNSEDLNILEGAILAGMLKAPSRYNPIASKQKAIERAKVVLGILREQNLLDEKGYNQALRLPIGQEKPARVQCNDYFGSESAGKSFRSVAEIYCRGKR